MDETVSKDLSSSEEISTEAEEKTKFVTFDPDPLIRIISSNEHDFVTTEEEESESEVIDSSSDYSVVPTVRDDLETVAEEFNQKDTPTIALLPIRLDSTNALATHEEMSFSPTMEDMNLNFDFSFSEEEQAALNEAVEAMADFEYEKRQSTPPSQRKEPIIRTWATKKIPMKQPRDADDSSESDRTDDEEEEISTTHQKRKREQKIKLHPIDLRCDCPTEKSNGFCSMFMKNKDGQPHESSIFAQYKALIILEKILLDSKDGQKVVVSEEEGCIGLSYEYTIRELMPFIQESYVSRLLKKHAGLSGTARALEFLEFSKLVGFLPSFNDEREWFILERGRDDCFFSVEKLIASIDCFKTFKRTLKQKGIEKKLPTCLSKFFSIVKRDDDDTAEVQGRAKCMKMLQEMVERGEVKFATKEAKERVLSAFQ